MAHRHNLHFHLYAAVEDAPARLGSHVRIAPNHISVLDPRTPEEIYGHGTNAKRKMLAHTFAAKTVVSFEPLLHKNLAVFRKQLDWHANAGTQANMRLILNYFLIDLFGQLLYGHKLGCLERGDDRLDAETKDGRIYKVPFIQCYSTQTSLIPFSP
ncbi:hypothetical protein BDV06DRAFT_228407 [Aspergillus oleicola]